VPLHRACAQEQLRADLRIRKAVSGEPRVLGLLRSELAAGLASLHRHLRRGQRAARTPGAISLAPIEDFRRDSDLFRESVNSSETQQLIDAAMQHGLQTRDAELELGAMVGALSDGPPALLNTETA
jgi:hypothetical protein